jgi:PEP-CTERM motif
VSTVIIGQVCDNTCFGYQPGDNTPDYLGLFGPVFGELIGPFTLNIGATDYALTINSHTISFPFNDPHLSISFTDPLLASFAPGAALFTATGFNPFGIAVAESEFLCPIPGVPEPATWLLMLVGITLAALRKRRPQGRFTVRVL